MKHAYSTIVHIWNNMTRVICFCQGEKESLSISRCAYSELCLANWDEINFGTFQSIKVPNSLILDIGKHLILYRVFHVALTDFEALF